MAGDVHYLTSFIISVKKKKGLIKAASFTKPSAFHLLY